MKNQACLFVCGFLLSGLAGATRLAAHPIPSPAVAVYAGRFDALNEETNEVGLEWRSAPRRFRCQPSWLPDLWPIAGVMATSRSAFYVYGGVALGCIGMFVRQAINVWRNARIGWSRPDDVTHQIAAD